MSWQATQKGRLNIHADNYYPTFGVFTGDQVDQLTQVGGGSGTLSTSVRAGEMYHIGSDTWPGSGVFFGFSVDFAPAPTNDDFAAQFPIRGVQVCVAG